MPPTRSQSLSANEATTKTKVPGPRKKKTDKSSKAPELSQTHLPSSVAQSSLFKLSPELRNIIYRLAVVSEDEVNITKAGGIPEPALLSISKIVRSETLGIFYHENEFTCVVRDYDPAPAVLALRRASKCGKPTGPRGIANFEFRCHREPNWKELVKWLHLCGQGLCVGLSRTDEDDTEDKMLAGLFDAVLDNPDITECSANIIMQAMRPVLAGLDKDWAKD